MSDRVYMTRATYDRKKGELDHFQNVEMPRITEKIAEARAEGDLKENAEYHGQREAQGMLQAKINAIRAELANAVIIDPDTIPKDQVAVGATVVVKNLKDHDEEEFTLVGAGDEDYEQERYLITSPIGQGLLGKKVGEKVEIQIPKGVLKYEVLDIRYEFYV